MKKEKIIDLTKGYYTYKEVNKKTNKQGFFSMFQTASGIDKRLGFNFKSGLYPLQTIKQATNTIYIVTMKYDIIHIIKYK